MAKADFQNLSDEELVHQGLAFEHSLVGSRIKHRLGKLENTSVLANLRKGIARVETLLTVREKAAGLSKGSLKAKYRSGFKPAAAAAPVVGEGFLKSMLDKSEAT